MFTVVGIVCLVAPVGCTHLCIVWCGVTYPVQNIFYFLIGVCAVWLQGKSWILYTMPFKKNIFPARQCVVECGGGHGGGGGSGGGRK